MPYIYVNGIRMYYISQGAGHPLLLITGVGYGGWFWHKVLPGLAGYYQVIVPDPRGSGQSDKPQGPYTVEMLATDMAELLDELHIRGAFVVGHSLGAFVAQHLVLNRPELVSKLVLAAGTFGGPNVVPITAEALEVLTSREGDQLELIQRGIEIATGPGFAEAHPEVVQELIEYRLSDAVPPHAYQAQVAAGMAMASAEASFEDRLSEIKVPTLILFGEHDRVVPPGNAPLLTERIPGAQMKILSGVGHIFPIEAPEATVKALREFFGEQKYYVGSEG